MHNHADSAPDNHVTLTFDLRVNTCQATVMHYVCTFQAVFPLEHGLTDRQTDTQTKSQMQLFTLLMHQLS